MDHVNPTHCQLFWCGCLEMSYLLVPEGVSVTGINVSVDEVDSMIKLGVVSLK